MHFNNAIALCLLLAMGFAQNAGIAPGKNSCDISSFVEPAGDAASNPLVKDCEAVLKKLTVEDEWSVTTSPKTLVRSGTCAFIAVVAPGQDTSVPANVGNADATDLINDSIRLFAKDGRVGAKGSIGKVVAGSGDMPCETSKGEKGHRLQVNWSLTTA